MVSDFICQLEKTFRQAYGNEQMSEERQLNEGFKYNLIKSPAVSGASGYQQLCNAARNEERHQNDLIKTIKKAAVSARRPVYKQD